MRVAVFLAASAFGAEACSIIELNRQGAFIVEDSLRTTSNPTKLVALLGEYNQIEDYGETRDPVSVAEITIDMLTGAVSSGYPRDVFIDDVFESTATSSINYTVEVCSSGQNATLNGPMMVEPFTFPINKGEPQAEFGHLQDVTVVSETLEQAYFFYNGDEGQPSFVVIDISDLQDLSYSATDYNDRPGYFNGPVSNIWDDIQVVALPENGADCFSYVYYHYNETSIRVLDYGIYAIDSFSLNAVTKEDDGDSYVYNVKNVLAEDVFMNQNRDATPLSYILEKKNIATGERTTLVLHNVDDAAEEVSSGLLLWKKAGVWAVLAMAVCVHVW